MQTHGAVRVLANPRVVARTPATWVSAERDALCAAQAPLRFARPRALVLAFEALGAGGAVHTLERAVDDAAEVAALAHALDVLAALRVCADPSSPGMEK
jgi:hypothetical protein